MEELKRTWFKIVWMVLLVASVGMSYLSRCSAIEWVQSRPFEVLKVFFGLDNDNPHRGTLCSSQHRELAHRSKILLAQVGQMAQGSSLWLLDGCSVARCYVVGTQK